MPDKLRQCETCGAVLEPEDLFCGECGEPVGSVREEALAVEAGPPALPAVPTPEETLPPPAGPATPPDMARPAELMPAVAESVAATPEPVAATPLPLRPSAPPSGSRSGWAIAAAATGAVGVLLCLVGAAAWALLAFSPTEPGMTETDNLVLSSLCCGLPLVGPAIVLIIVAIVIWSVRLRKKQ